MERVTMREAMITSISEVLETMFFLPLDISEVELGKGIIPTLPQKLIGCTLRFSGLFGGELVFLIPLPLARTLTADFVGEDREEIDERTVEETTKELLNMITGKTLSLFDSNALFRLGIPEVMEADQVRSALYPEDGQETIMLLLNAKDERMAVKMVVRA